MFSITCTCWRAQGAKVTGHRDPLPHQAAACGGRARARGRARNGILWRWRTQSPGGWGRGVAQDHHLNPTEQPRGPGGTVSPLSLSPSWVQQARRPRLWPGSNGGGSGHSFHRSEFTHHTLCPAPCWGLLTDCMFGRGRGGLPTQGTVRCGWGPAQGRRVSAPSCPARGSLSGRPG